MTALPDKRFRIAFSFAGEKREFVEKVAAILAVKLGKEKILYDKYHEAEFAVFNLGIKLPKLYGEESELIVPVICGQYDEKRWTGWEWVHIYGLLTMKDGHRVMPSRFDHAVADGLSPAAGFIELDEKTPEVFAELILERLAINEGKSKDYYARTAVARAPIRAALPQKTPHNLPRLQAFFGRKTEMDVIQEALNPEVHTWGVLIDGPGGMGKTSLAVKAARECAPSQFQRIIFISVKGHELEDYGERAIEKPTRPEYLEILHQIALALDQPDITLAPEMDQGDLVLQALKATGVLLIIDNLETTLKEDLDRLHGFIKFLPNGCKAILTSRRHIGSSADTVMLGRLEPKAAFQLLSYVARRNPLLARTTKEERRRLYQATNGIPLLLRWTSGQLGRDSCRTIEHALDRLRNPQAENDPLEFVIGDLVKDFTPTEVRVIATLSQFDVPLLTKRIAELAGYPEEITEKTLGSLANRSLVIPDEEERHFMILPIVAGFFKRKLSGAFETKNPSRNDCTTLND